MYSVVDILSVSIEASSTKEVMKSRMVVRSASRPAISLSALLQVARKSVRARVCRGREDNGVGGGVEIENRVESEAVSTEARVDVDACRRIAGATCQTQLLISHIRSTH